MSLATVINFKQRIRVTPETRGQIEAQLRGLRTFRGELDGLLSDARDGVRTWLDALNRAIEREKSFLQDKEDIADGEISAPYGMYRNAVTRLRHAQELQKATDLDIQDAIATLADDELWKDGQ